MNKTVTIIPARGGSKGIPKKNLQVINGKSLIERSISFSQNLPNNRVIVSSDCSEILKIAKANNVEVFQRSSSTATDTASSESVVLEVIENLEIADSIITLLQPTSPFMDIEAWVNSIDYLRANPNVHSMFSAASKNDFAWEFESEWLPVNHDKRNRLPRQHKPITAQETGSFYVFLSKYFKLEKTRFCGNTKPVFTKVWSHFDIDTEEELNFCRDLSKILDFPPYSSYNFDA
jgi:CMP-N-acetylneuraminic acid synthetase